MIKMTLSEMANILGSASITSDVEFQGISIDTRTLTKENLFIAIKGEQFDGHTFIKEAQNKKASAVLVNHKIDLPIPQIIVEDTIIALGKISAYWRDQFSLPIVGITGSNGKTTLKNMIAAILRAACKNEASVLATEGNLNNHIGVPLMLSRLNNNHQFGVIEMGMNHFGEIDYLTHIVKPHIAIINNAAAAHLQGVNDISGVARAKGEIFAGLDSHGIAILNKDDLYFEYWHDLIKQRKQITFGLQHGADVTAILTNLPNIDIETPKGKFNVKLPLLGRHNIMNALAATAATLALDISLNAIKEGLENVKPAPGRLRQHNLPDNITIIDDTYNANPASVSAAINTLTTLSGTKILVLGDMRELGNDAKQLHAEIGNQAFKAGINYLFTLGELSAAATHAFGENAIHFTERETLLETVKNHLHTNTNILIKGSRSMQMEKIVSGLLPHNETEHTH